MSLTASDVQRVTAEALVTLGRADEARVLCDSHLLTLERLGARGVYLGIAHETCARVALARRDEPALRQHAERCAQGYSVGRNAALSARYERLLRDAASAGLPLAAVAEPAVAPEAEASRARDAARTVYSRMLTCISPSERAQRGLQLVLEATGAEAGYLFGLRSGKLQAMASTEAADAPADLKAMLDDFVQREFEQDDASGDVSLLARARRLGAVERLIDELGREFEPLLLAGQHHGETMIAGVAALHFRDDERKEPRGPMLDAVVAALVAEDVIDPITCVA